MLFVKELEYNKFSIYFIHLFFADKKKKKKTANSDLNELYPNLFSSF